MASSKSLHDDDVLAYTSCLTLRCHNASGRETLSVPLRKLGLKHMAAPSDHIVPLRSTSRLKHEGHRYTDYNCQSIVSTIEVAVHSGASHNSYLLRVNGTVISSQ
jgi:hypothetical protein